MKIVIASDHGGYELKGKIIEHLKEQHMDVIDCGTNSTESVDYPDYAKKACQVIQKGNADLGILICGTGIGMSIAANKMHGIRAALCSNEYDAEYARMHNDANILTLGARVTGEGLALNIVDRFLAGQFAGGRHARRIGKIAEIESEESHD
jgi:ribose 5-phosphate isomerase B